MGKLHLLFIWLLFGLVSPEETKEAFSCSTSVWKALHTVLIDETKDLCKASGFHASSTVNAFMSRFKSGQLSTGLASLGASTARALQSDTVGEECLPAVLSVQLALLLSESKVVPLESLVYVLEHSLGELFESKTGLQTVLQQRWPVFCLFSLLASKWTADPPTAPSLFVQPSSPAGLELCSKVEADTGVCDGKVALPESRSPFGMPALLPYSCTLFASLLAQKPITTTHGSNRTALELPRAPPSIISEDVFEHLQQLNAKVSQGLKAAGLKVPDLAAQGFQDPVGNTTAICNPGLCANTCIAAHLAAAAGQVCQEQRCGNSKLIAHLAAASHLLWVSGALRQEGSGKNAHLHALLYMLLSSPKETCQLTAYSNATDPASPVCTGSPIGKMMLRLESLMLNNHNNRVPPATPPSENFELISSCPDVRGMVDLEVLPEPPYFRLSVALDVSPLVSYDSNGQGEVTADFTSEGKPMGAEGFAVHVFDPAKPLAKHSKMLCVENCEGDALARLVAGELSRLLGGNTTVDTEGSVFRWLQEELASAGAMPKVEVFTALRASWRVVPDVPCADVQAYRYLPPDSSYRGVGLFVSGEPYVTWTKEALEAGEFRMVHIGAKRQDHLIRGPSVHVPYGSLFFATDLVSRSPLDLAVAPRTPQPEAWGKRLFALYVQHRCYLFRESFFLHLQEVAELCRLGDVVPLGKCTGESARHDFEAARAPHGNIMEAASRQARLAFYNLTDLCGPGTKAWEDFTQNPAGSTTPPAVTVGERFSGLHYDSFLETAQQFKFVLAMENSVQAGYVSEKPVLPLLAGAIPLYWGTGDVESVLNSRAIVHINKFRLGFSGHDASSDWKAEGRQCATDPAAEDAPAWEQYLPVFRHIVAVAQDPEATRELLAEPMLSLQQLKRHFSWHRDVRRLFEAPAHFEVGANGSVQRVVEDKARSGWASAAADVPMLADTVQTVVLRQLMHV